MINEIKLGDVYEVLKSIDDNIFDMGVTSPPYNKKKNSLEYPHVICTVYSHLEQEGSNLRMSISKTDALPLGYAPDNIISIK